MNPIYKFELTIGETTERCYPIYKDDLSKDYELQSNQQFFRAKLSGKLTFQSVDYNRIVAAAFDTQFLLEIFISYDAGQTWASYWKGTFWKTDCTFDGDAQTVTVTPSVNDQYTDVLAGMEKEYNLIDLLPEIVPVKFDKRPMIQIYVPGESVIACFLSGMWWEQECDVVNESDTVEISGQNVSALEYKYSFYKNTTGRIVDISGTMSPELPPAFVLTNPPASPYFSIDNGTYTFWAYRNEDDPSNPFDEWYITRNSDNLDLWYGRLYSSQQSTIPYSVILHPVEGTEAIGDVEISVRDVNVYARYVCDVLEIRGNNTYPLPYDDLVENNRNYHRAIGYAVNNVIFFSARLTNNPTKWGIYQPGLYYLPPYFPGSPEIFPISRNSWSAVSIWFSFSAMDWLLEEAGRAEFTLKDAFPLSSVISVLLAKIAPNLTHEATADYSEFLYDTNQITWIAQTLLITPKSNVINAGYDQPAQKAPITLKSVMDMLRDCFRCYWFVDDENRFRIEHIKFFMAGGSYTDEPVVGTDLTIQQETRNGKPWAYGRDQYSFNKPNMAARYQFGWMDDVTQLFDGYPIDIVSKFVNPDNIEEINIAKFTSDIDYILLNPGEISNDGFVLLGAKQDNQLAQTENYVYDDAITFRQPVPDDWLGKKLKISVNVDIGQIAFRSFGGGTFVQSNWVSGMGIAEITIQNNASGIYIIGGTLNANISVYSISFGEFILPYINFNFNNTDHWLQNAYLAFIYLQTYYAYDMPAYNYEINGVRRVASGIKKLKTQTLKFPMLEDPDLLELIKTNIGDGMIEKLSVNLSSRNANATLKYDTE